MNILVEIKGVFNLAYRCQRNWVDELEWIWEYYIYCFFFKGFEDNTLSEFESKVYE